MEPPHSYNDSRAEALRWLNIAEKLLTTRDLVGSRTFAIRARDSDPGLEPAYQIIAVVEVLIAGEKRINNQHDWYAILQLGPDTLDLEVIANQYRRFALLLNPNYNKFAFSDHAFRLVVDAWSVLSNPATKALYDNELNLFSKFTPKFTPNPIPNPNPLGFVPILQQVPSPPTPPPAPAPSPQPAAQQSQQSRRSPRKIVNDNVNNNEKNVGGEGRENGGTRSQNPSFWTACPYCYYMYEYPRIYAECTVRCQNCQRAFQAVVIPSPPPIVDGKDDYFCCWGFYPVGFAWSNFQKNMAGGSNWTPFSQMFTCPQAGGTSNVNVGAAKKPNAPKNTASRVYVDDEDVYVELSESSESSDDDWNNNRKTKKTKNVRGKGSATKNGKTPQAEKGKNVKRSGNENLQGAGAPNASLAESSKKAAGNNSRKAGGRNAKDWGKLDLNVEFSNEVEDPTPGVNEGNGVNAGSRATDGNRVNEGNRAGNGEEENIEGIGFFEGLDEFLSSLPILSVVGDDKVKAT